MNKQYTFSMFISRPTSWRNAAENRQVYCENRELHRERTATTRHHLYTLNCEEPENQLQVDLLL